MQQFVVSIQPDLIEPASVRPLEGVFDVDSYRVGSMDFNISGGIRYNLLLTNTGEGILLSGTASCTANTPCARCLEPATIEVEGDVEGYFLLEDASEVDGYEDDEFEVVAPDGTFDIAPAIVAALVHATPFIVLCKDDCAGLCPKCGADLNEGPCGCDLANEPDPLNPFSVLKDMDFSEN